MVPQERGQGGLLSVNFGKQLLEAFEEVKLWGSLDFSIPSSARQLQADAERLRLLRGNVAALVSHYNKVPPPPLRTPLSASSSSQKVPQFYSPSLSSSSSAVAEGHQRCLRASI